MTHSPAINSLREFLVRFFSQIGLVRRIFLVMAALTLLVTFLLPTTYTTTGEIIVLSAELYQKESISPGSEMSPRYLPVTLKDLETEATILRSIPLLKKTVAALYSEGKLYIELTLLDKFIKQPLSEYVIKPIKNSVKEMLQRLFSITEEPELEDPQVVELTKMVLDSLEIVPLPGSNVIVINYETKDLQMGRVFTDRLMDEYLALRSHLMTGSVNDEVFLQKKKLYQERLYKLSEEKIKFFDEYEIHNPNEELSIVLQTINSETTDYNQLSDRLLNARQWQQYYEKNIAQLAFTKAGEISVSSSLSGGLTSNGQQLPDQEMLQQFEQLNTLRAQYDTAALTYSPDTPQVQQLQDQLENSKKRIISMLKTRQKELQQETFVLEETIRQKQSRINAYKERASILTKAMVKETGLDTELSVVNDAFSNYSRQFEEIRSENLLNKEKWKNVRVLSYAPIPLEPSSPKKPLVLVIGMIASCITAVSIGFFVEIFDQRFHTPDQLATHLGVPVIAVIDAENNGKAVPFSLHPVRFLQWLTQ